MRRITVDSIIIPRAALREAALASGIHDSSPHAEAPVRLADHLNHWYRRNGYMFARVVARSSVRDGNIRLVVSEPVVAPQSVTLRYYAAAEDSRPGSSALSVAPGAPQGAPTIRERWRRAAMRWTLSSAARPWASSHDRAVRYETALRSARAVGLPSEALRLADARLQALRQRANLPPFNSLELGHSAGNLVIVSGCTRESVVARALSLRAGEPFRWDERAWDQLQRCGLFEVVEARARFVPPPPDPAATGEKGVKESGDKQPGRGALYVVNRRATEPENGGGAGMGSTVMASRGSEQPPSAAGSDGAVLAAAKARRSTRPVEQVSPR